MRYRCRPDPLRLDGAAFLLYFDDYRNIEGSPAMKRLHVHVSVEDVTASIRFYKTLFATEPTVIKSDYAKWMLEDPRVNFAISKRGGAAGIRHLGIQVENGAELADVYSRLKSAEAPVVEEGATTCCYAESEKSWIADPQGVQWETFLTTGESTVYGTDPIVESVESAERAPGAERAPSGEQAPSIARSSSLCCAPAALAVPVSIPTRVCSR